MKKKIALITLVIAVVTMLSCFSAFTVSAATLEKPALSFTSFDVVQGDTFTTTLYFEKNSNVCQSSLTMLYDTEKVSLIRCEPNEDSIIEPTVNTTVNGQIKLTFGNGKNINAELALVDITFKVSDTLGEGNYNLLELSEKDSFVRRLDADNIVQNVDFTFNTPALNIYKAGDINLDGDVNGMDAVYILRYEAGLSSGREGSSFYLPYYEDINDYDEHQRFILKIADAYYDGLVNGSDSVSILRHEAGFTEELLGNRVNVNFYDADFKPVISKSVVFGESLTVLPKVPTKEGYSDGQWSLSPSEYVEPNFNNIESSISVFACYDSSTHTTDAMEYYKKYLTEMYYGGNLATGLSSDLNLLSTINYQAGYKANLVWNSDSNYVLNSTTGKFTKPTYPQELNLSVKIISYDNNNMIEGQDKLVLFYNVPGIYKTPKKSEIEDFLKFYFTDNADGQYRVNYDVKLLSKINNTVLPAEGALYDNFEIRLDWFQNVNGVLEPLSQIKRTTAVQHNDYVAVATFNGKPIDEDGGDGKIYIDDVEVTAIDQLEIKNFIINQIAAYQGSLATNGTHLWNNDIVYGTNVTWETGNSKIAYIADNVIELKEDAVSGSTLPINARVSYLENGEPTEFILSYNLTVSCDNTIIKAPENMDPELYKAIKEELEENLGYRGDLTSAALASVKFVNLDLSGHPDISSLRGLSYCTNLRTLNISGLHITDGTMNQIATLSYLEAFIARNCGLDNLTDGGTPTLRNAVNLKMIDLTGNNFTNLDSVFASDKKYGQLREVYLSSNKLTDISALSRAPMMTYLSLSDNGLTTDGITAVADYPFLQYLSLADNKIDSISALKNLKYLKELRLQNNNLSNINDLRRLVNLEILYLGHNSIQDIGFLNSMTALQVLYANDNQIQEISALTDLTKLEIINLNNNKLSSLAVLGHYKSTLTEIYAENNNLTDFSFINGANKLHILMLAGNKTDMIQANLNTWLSKLSEMEVLTLSNIKLSDLSFLESMEKIVRLDVADCGLNAFAGENSNIENIANRYATLRILNISNNNLGDTTNEILKLRNVTLLTVLYGDNICSNLDAHTLTYSMPELRYISLENCGIDTMKWLFKYSNLVYVDLAGNAITEVDFDAYISNASLKTLKELYLDTTAENCSFANAYRITDFNVEKLSLENVKVGKMEKLPYLDNIKYLNLANTGLNNFTGDDLEISDLYSIERYTTLQTIDISGLDTDITLLENMPSIKTVYAVSMPSDTIFHKTDLLSLYRMYNNGVVVYLYDKVNPLKPTSAVEGEKILGEVPDFSCDITVAANNVISDNNPLIVDEINDFDITWTLSNSDNYEIVNNHLAVKDYSGIEDEKLIVTAEITVYPDQPKVTREFVINTHILRASSDYYDIVADNYSEQITRSTAFKYEVVLKPNITDGFTNPVMPVEDNISYKCTASTANGTAIPYKNVISGDAGQFAITDNAPIDSTATITIGITHNSKSGDAVLDTAEILVPIKVVSRTYTATFITNGATIVDANGADQSTIKLSEESLIFEGLKCEKIGYIFDGWYTDAEFKTLFSKDGTDAMMPSHDITLYAKWIAHSFTLTFDANGGSVSENSRTVLCDTAFEALPTPTWTGRTFEGWYTAKTGGTKITTSTSMATAEPVTVYAHWTVNAYTAQWNTGTGYTITVSRTSSPNKGAATGTISSGATVYYGDVLSVTYTKADYYTIKSKGKTSVTVTGNITASDIYATAELNPLSDWVKATDVPSGAKVESTKWKYRQSASSSSSTMSGYTFDHKTRTSWGTEKGPVYTKPTDSELKVRSESYVVSSNYKTVYCYYRDTLSQSDTGNTVWGYSTMYRHYYEFDYQLTDSYQLSGKTLYKYWYEAANGNTRSGHYKPVFYSGTDKRWVSDNYGTRWYYQEPVYTYYFYKDTETTDGDPTGKTGVSNVVKYVKYRAK